MAGMLRRLTDFARSPQGRELIAKGRKMAQDPKNQQRLKELSARLNKRRNPSS